jgi:hypothetical protein
LHLGAPDEARRLWHEALAAAETLKGTLADEIRAELAAIDADATPDAGATAQA